MRRVLLFIFIAVVISCSSYAQKSGLQHWKSKDILSSVGLILSYNDIDCKWHPFGTGVFLDIDSSLHHVFFVTNRHILINKDSLKIKIPNYTSKGDYEFLKEQVYTFTKKDQAFFIPKTSDSDFAFIIVDRPNFPGFKALTRDDFLLTPALEYGQDVEFYGYPLFENFKLFKGSLDFPILRSGNISFFVSDTSIGGMLPSMFLIDGVSYGGGSGSPVFCKQYYIENNEIKIRRKLIGIITGHFPVSKIIQLPLSQVKINSILEDSSLTSDDSVLVSKILNDVIFSYEENSDLAIVVSLDIIEIYIVQNYLDWFTKITKEFINQKE